jgi:hypothetical protein
MLNQPDRRCPNSAQQHAKAPARTAGWPAGRALTGTRHPLRLPPAAAVPGIAAEWASFVIVHPLTVVIDLVVIRSRRRAFASLVSRSRPQVCDIKIR